MKRSIKTTFRRVLLMKSNERKGLGFALDLIPIGLEYIADVGQECTGISVTILYLTR